MASQQQAPAGGFSKRHVSGMLKHLVDEEQRAKAYEVAAAYKKLFADKKWEPVMARMQRVAEEDHLRVVSRRRPAPATPAARPLLTTSTSAPPVALANRKTPPAGLTRLNTSTNHLPVSRVRASSTRRERWDLTYRGPATPLTPTPMGNAFSGGGFWEQLTPKTPLPTTPVTAIAPSSLSPIVPRDIEARAAYNHVKAEVDAMARTACASRISVHSKIDNSDDIPKTLVSPKDALKGAEITLHCRQAHLKSIIDPDLPKKLEELAYDEAKILQQYSVRHALELLDIDLWLQVDEQTLNFTTLLDAQRELILMHRNRRKSRALKLPDSAIQQAWATRILKDAERAVEADGDASSTNSDEDKGYNYNNFLRSIKHEVSSSSDLASMAGNQSYTDLASLRSSGKNADSLVLNTEMMMVSQRSSANFKKTSGPALRSLESSFSNNRIVGKELSAASQRSSTSPRKFSSLPLGAEKSNSSNSPSPEKRASAVANSRGLTVFTTNINKEDEEIMTPELSPEDRAFRRMGASHLELNNWAQQLKEMEERHTANKNLGSSAHRRQHPAFCSRLQDRQGSSGSADSLKCEGAEEHEREASMHNIDMRAFAAKGGQDESPLNQNSAKHSPFKQNLDYTRHSNAVLLPSSSSVSASPSTSKSSSHSTSPSRSRTLADLTSFTLPPPPLGFKYAASNKSLHDTIRRKQHVRSKSSIARADKKEKEEEEEWTRELKRMESRERIRQQEEMNKRRCGSAASGHSGREKD